MEKLTCNLLMKQSNVDQSSTPKYAQDAVGRFGNWVGGSVTIDSENIVFQMNALNAKFQKDTGDIGIPRNQIDNIAEGRLMLFFRTVDIKAMGLLFRFRLMGKGHKKFLDLVS